MSGCVPAHFCLVLCPVASRILSGCPMVRRPGGAIARWPDDLLLCPDMPGYARNMPGYARIYPDMPDAVSLPELSGDCCTGCERPNAPRQVRRWLTWRSPQLTARDNYGKCHDSQATPAASPARGCWAAGLTLLACVRSYKAPWRRIVSTVLYTCHHDRRRESTHSGLHHGRFSEHLNQHTFQDVDAMMCLCRTEQRLLDARRKIDRDEISLGIHVILARFINHPE